MHKRGSEWGGGLGGGGSGGGGWGGGPNVGCRLKCHPFVGKPQLIFLSLVGIFFLVLSVASNIFSPFVASRLTQFTPS